MTTSPDYGTEGDAWHLDQEELIEQADESPALAHGTPVYACEPLPTTPKGSRSWQGGQQLIVAGAPAVRIVGFMPSRRQVIITNTSVFTCYLGHDAGTTSDTVAYPLNGSATITIPSTADVWAYVAASAGGNALLGMLHLYEDGN